MSFVYAQKIGQSIAIFADTKITFDTGAPHFFGPETEKRVRQFGMIKNIIVSKNFCICFAGNNILYANELLQQINSVSLEQILQLALNINRKDIANGAEFIVCYADKTTQLIYQIKDGVCEELPLAWVGSCPVSSTHRRAHATKANLVCRLLLEQKNPGKRKRRHGVR